MQIRSTKSGKEVGASHRDPFPLPLEGSSLQGSNSMSKNALILEKVASKPPALLEAVPSSGEYSDLIRSLFQGRSVVAVVDSGSGSRAPEACRGIAAELAASGNRAVIVRVASLLRMSQLPDATACLPGRAPNVFLWPRTAG